MRTELTPVPDAADGDDRVAIGFERFFRAQFPLARRIAFGVLRDAQLAEDIAQDVLIAAERRFGDPEHCDHAAAWVRVAASHLALNAVRDRRRLEERHRRQPLPRPEGLPEELLIAREQDEQVRAALGRIGRRAATVLVLRHSGLSYSEVAAAMGVKVGHVGTMLRRAEAALRKEVDRAPRP